MPTKIPYLDENWSPIIGCSHCSPGCASCWAEKTARRLAGISKTSDKYSYVLSKDVAWSGRTFFDENMLNKPLHWKKPRNIGVCFMGDLFHESVPFEWIEKVFSRFNKATQHNYLILTKRPERMRDFIQECDNNFIKTEYFKNSMPNVWLGVSVCNQDETWKIDVLRDIPAAHRWVSFEPLLGSINTSLVGIGWSVAGIESGSKRRHIHPTMINDIVDIARRDNVPVYVKQIEINGKVCTDINQFPKDLQIQEYPKELRHE